MPTRRKPRTLNLEAGSYSIRTDVRQDGGITLTLICVSADRGIHTVLYLSGAAPEAAPDGGTLVAIADAYDSTNRLAIAPGGGRPSEESPR